MPARNPGTAPAASAPPNVMISSDGTGMQADSASMRASLTGAATWVTRG